MRVCRVESHLRRMKTGRVARVHAYLKKAPKSKRRRIDWDSGDEKFFKRLKAQIADLKENYKEDKKRVDMTDPNVKHNMKNLLTEIKRKEGVLSGMKTRKEQHDQRATERNIARGFLVEQAKEMENTSPWFRKKQQTLMQEEAKEKAQRENQEWIDSQKHRDWDKKVKKNQEKSDS